MKIILDTNFLMIPAQFKVDIFSEIDRLFDNYELFVVDRTKEELEKLGKGKGKDGTAARIALKLINDKNVAVVKTEEKHADDSIISACKENTLVATQDKELKRKLKLKKIKVVTMRGKSHLIVV